MDFGLVGRPMHAGRPIVFKGLQLIDRRSFPQSGYHFSNLNFHLPAAITSTKQVYVKSGKSFAKMLFIDNYKKVD